MPKSRRGFVVLLAAFAAAPLFASAQPAAPPALSELDREKARALFELGEAYFKAAEYDKALESYRGSYEISKRPELLFNMGQCYRQLGENEEAVKSYRAFLEGLPDSKLRPEVEELVRKLEAAPAPPPPPPASMALAPEPPAEAPASAPVVPEGKRRWARFLLPAGLVLAGAGAGAASLSIVSEARQNPGAPDSRRRLAFGLGAAADAAFVAAAVTLFFAVVKGRAAPSSSAGAASSRAAAR
jgi:tetratricopeptide (TPR) repeat protein